MRLLISPRAARDLEEIGDYIARDNPQRAVTFIREIRDHCKEASLSPLLYPSRDELAQGIRIIIHDRYRIFFTLRSEEMRIERIIHSARDTTEL